MIAPTSAEAGQHLSSLPPSPDGSPGPAAVAVSGVRNQFEMRVRGQAVGRLLLSGVSCITFGRSEENEVVLADPSISRKHATVERVPDGFLVTDLHSRAGSLANGRRFEQHRLVIGDQLQMGPFFFRFDGQALERTSGLAGIEIEAQHVSKRAGGAGSLLGLGTPAPVTTILDDVSVKIERGQFVAILGPSGSGKSSLLDTLTGLRPGQAGRILFDKADFYVHYNQLHSLLGYVPQDDIVHTELTVAQAMLFSAKLRLPAGTPGMEIEKLVVQTVERLGLTPRAHTPIARLSGGQRKRVSVGVELLARPAVLFLDEPTSGLDPAAEFKLMSLLRDLADGGCTVICTTHVMENVYLTDRIFVIASGRLVFAGNSAQAREHFAIQKLNQLYDRLEERPAEEWHQRFVRFPMPSGAAVPPPPPIEEIAATAPPLLRPKRRSRQSGLGTLLARQWTILGADWKNFLILFGQPLIIAALVAWIANQPKLESFQPTSLNLFFAYLATLWFGCSNAAQEIVRELSIYRREHMVGLGRGTYLTSKFLMVTGVTVLQGWLLYFLLRLYGTYFPSNPEKAFEGFIPWQLLSLAGIAFASVGIGLVISAFSRTPLQAVMIVPLVLIPQIIFSGAVVPAKEMTDRVWTAAQLVPSYAAQIIMDESLYWKRRVDGSFVADHQNAYYNLAIQLDHRYKKPEGDIDERDQSERPIPWVTPEDTESVFRNPWPGIWAASKLFGWGVLSFVAAYLGLRRQEKG